MADPNNSSPPQDSLLARFIEHATGPMGLASIGKELSYAVTDIRQKVVEEGMYGRQVTPAVIESLGTGRDPLGRSMPGEKQSFEERCSEVAASAPAEQTHEHGPDH